MLYAFCKKYNVPHKKTGKLVVATNSREEEYLSDVLSTAQDNGVPDIQLIDGNKARKYEPNICACSALYVPTSGIVEPTELVRTFHTLAQNNNVVFAHGNEVVSVEPKTDAFKITIMSGSALETFKTKILINAAGLYSDTLAMMVNPDSSYHIFPVRGESAKFYKLRRSNISMSGMNIYPTPYGFYNSTGEKADVSLERFKQLLKEGVVTKTVGVHLTPTFGIVHGEYGIG